MNKKIFLSCFFLFCVGCFHIPDKIEPQINYTIQERHMKSLSSAFLSLSDDEKQTYWGQEFTIGVYFARELDLYRALSSFKRAEILMPPSSTERQLELQYYIVLCYYLGKKYEEAIENFELSHLPHVDKSFSAFHDLLLILYDSYKEMGDEEKALRIHELIDESFPDTGKKLTVATAVSDADIEKIENLSTQPQNNYLKNLLSNYREEKKSIGKAQGLNAILPGAGYLYLGQGKSALTAFLINGLFIAATYEFFHKNYVAAGIITASFEAGWYFGGIYGAGEEAKFYNEKKYEECANKLMNEKKLFPLFMLQHSF